VKVLLNTSDVPSVNFNVCAVTGCNDIDSTDVFASLPVREERSPSPDVPSARPASPVRTESESAPVSSDFSATATTNENVSEGQWVVNVLSEGEVADLEANECK